MKKQLTLTIKLEELKKIVSGQKKEEYRDSKEFYHRIFKELDENFYVIDAPDTILLRAGYDLKKPYAIVKVDKIRHEEFLGLTKPIPEDFQKGDLAYVIYISEVLEHNLFIN